MNSQVSALIAAIAIFATGFLTTQTSQADQYISDFASFKETHGKTYSTAEEEAYRFGVFMTNGMQIEEHNSKNEGSTWGYTQFADMTHDEFAKQYLTLKQKQFPSEEVYEDESFVGDVNWVTAGKVQAVKNQGSCGSCWAFSTAASAESLKAIKGGKLGDFSEQQLVDCSTSYGNQGCNGGLMDDGFKYYAAHGICTESSYPYKGKDGTCKANSCTKDSFKISGYTDVKAKSTSALKSACDKQPVSVAVDASIAWQLYFGGIMAGWECGKSLDHGVLLAGYSDADWLIKNSWGKTWGESGYIRLKGDADTCGLADQASIPK